MHLWQNVSIQNFGRRTVASMKLRGRLSPICTESRFTRIQKQLNKRDFLDQRIH